MEKLSLTTAGGRARRWKQAASLKLNTSTCWDPEGPLLGPYTAEARASGHPWTRTGTSTAARFTVAPTLKFPGGRLTRWNSLQQAGEPCATTRGSRDGSREHNVGGEKPGPVQVYLLSPLIQSTQADTCCMLLGPKGSGWERVWGSC